MSFSVGSYMIVEDSNVNGHPVFPDHGPGPMEALDEFMKSSTNFEIDKSREKHLITFNPKGYLKRIS
jgi:cephalosporin hydroxylase